jgi:hypothetical protein
VNALWNFVGDGLDVPITNMFDLYGNEVTDPGDATTLVALLPDGQWLACECYSHEIKQRIFS